MWSVLTMEYYSALKRIIDGCYYIASFRTDVSTISEKTVYRSSASYNYFPPVNNETVFTISRNLLKPLNQI